MEGIAVAADSHEYDLLFILRSILQVVCPSVCSLSEALITWVS